MLSGRERAAVHSDLHISHFFITTLSSTLFLDLAHFSSVAPALSSSAVTYTLMRVHTSVSQGFADDRRYHA